MLIGFCGSGGTGKTTTAKALCEKTGLAFRASSSRAIFEKRGLTERAQIIMAPAEQYALQLEIFTARVMYEKTFSNGVCDRTLLDQAAYNLLRAHPVLTADQHAALMRLTIRSLRRYNLLFYFPLVTFASSGDGMRDDAWGSRYLFDCIIRTLIRSNIIHTLPVPIESVNARVAMIMKHMEGVK